MANEHYTPTSTSLCAALALRCGDFTNKTEITQQVALATLNQAALRVFQRLPKNRLESYMFERGVSVSVSSGVGSLPDGTGSDPAVLYVTAATDEDGNFIHLMNIATFQKNVSSSILGGTATYPIAGVDLKNYEIKIDPADTETITIDYVVKPYELKINGVSDVTGSAYTATQNPNWPSQLSQLILEDATEIIWEMKRREKKGEDLTADKIMVALQEVV